MADDDYLLTYEAYVLVDDKHSMKDKRSVVDKNPMMDEHPLTDNSLTDEHSLADNYALVGEYWLVDKNSSVDKVNKYLAAADQYTVTDYEDGILIRRIWIQATAQCRICALGQRPEAEQGRGTKHQKQPVSK